MAKTTKKTKPRRSLEDILLNVPVHAFVAMIARSGMPTEDAREATAAFKELKEMKG